MRDIVLITGSAGLIGSEASRFFAAKDFNVVGFGCPRQKTFVHEREVTENDA